MGNEEVVEEEPDNEGTPSNESAPDIVTDQDTNEEDAKPAKKLAPELEKREDNSSDTKKNPDDLRKVIKVGSSEGAPRAEPQKPEGKKVEPGEDDSEPTTRESLEQKRTILQSIKDFDFQIKKNQEDLTLLNKKIDNVVKDLDDLVSLYEIVSEQMNPFVGLSKVTKKRIDALENFTKEIELLKERTGELESYTERSGVELKKPSIKELPTKEGNLNVTPETDNAKYSKEIDEAFDEEGQKPKTELPEEEMDSDISIELSTEEDQQPISINVGDNNVFSEFSDSDWDLILERACGDMFPEGKIDMIIDEFIESLKG